MTNIWHKVLGICFVRRKTGDDKILTNYDLKILRSDKQFRNWTRISMIRSSVEIGSKFEKDAMTDFQNFIFLNFAPISWRGDKIFFLPFCKTPNRRLWSTKSSKKGRPTTAVKPRFWLRRLTASKIELRSSSFLLWSADHDSTFCGSGLNGKTLLGISLDVGKHIWSEFLPVYQPLAADIATKSFEQGPIL